MPTKKGSGKKGGFLLAPITLSEPVKTTDGFTNLVDLPANKEKTAKAESNTNAFGVEEPEAKNEISANRLAPLKHTDSTRAEDKSSRNENENRTEQDEKSADYLVLTEKELLRILDAHSLDEIYELTDVLRASSLKLYATLVRLADERGRIRVKNHELMSKAGIKGIATLYKQERWLMDLKLLKKRAKPGPHDGSSYVVYGLESLPLPAEISEKFAEYLSGLK